MTKLRTSYLGLALKHPIIASSCGLTGTLKGITECARCGAAAIVLKSLFEEQIDAELGLAVDSGLMIHPEARDYLNGLGKTHGPDSYLKLITDAAGETDVPIIASVNCLSERWWVDFAVQIEQAGAAAIELNIGIQPAVPAADAAELEARMAAIVRAVKERMTIPVAVKIGPNFTSLPSVIDRLATAGADGIVLFNRFYRLDIDTEAMAFKTGDMISTPAELHLPLRWVALLSPHVRVPISLSTGVHEPTDVIKAMLVGAQVVQVASVLYNRKPTYLQTLIEGLQIWLDQHGYDTIDAVRGQLSARHAEAREALGRIQYIKALTGVS